MFDEEMLSIAMGMNKTHRNSANIHVNDGKVIILNGDGTFAVKYEDSSLAGKKFSFPIGEFPSKVDRIYVSGENIEFIKETSCSKKTITVRQVDNHFDELNEFFNGNADIKIKDELINSLDNDLTFFRILYDKGEIKLKQIHGYTGRINLIELKRTGFDKIFEDTKEYFEIGCFTDIFKFIYSIFNNIKFQFIPKKIIYGTAKKGTKKVEFIISDIEWDE